MSFFSFQLNIRYFISSSGLQSGIFFFNIEPFGPLGHRQNFKPQSSFIDRKQNFEPLLAFKMREGSSKIQVQVVLGSSLSPCKPNLGPGPSCQLQSINVDGVILEEVQCKLCCFIRSAQLHNSSEGLLDSSKPTSCNGYLNVYSINP